MTTYDAFMKLNENPELAAKVKNECKTPEEIYEVLKSLGLDQSFEDFKKNAKEINDALSSLDEKDVDAIVGGGDSMTTLTTTTTASVAAMAVI